MDAPVNSIPLSGKSKKLGQGGIVKSIPSLYNTALVIAIEFILSGIIIFRAVGCSSPENLLLAEIILVNATAFPGFTRSKGSTLNRVLGDFLKYDLCQIAFSIGIELTAFANDDVTPHLPWFLR